jgi:hypothetical protein
MVNVAEAVAAVERDLICERPKMRRTGKTDVSDLQVATNELTPVSEPLYVFKQRHETFLPSWQSTFSRSNPPSDRGTRRDKYHGRDATHANRGTAFGGLPEPRVPL